MEKSFLQKTLEETPEIKKTLAQAVRAKLDKKLKDLNDDEILEFAGGMQEIDLSVLLGKRDPKEAVLDTTLEDLLDNKEISVRAYNCLKGFKINTLRDYISHSEQEILKIRNFAKGSLKEMRKLLKSKGIKPQE